MKKLGHVLNQLFQILLVFLIGCQCYLFAARKITGAIQPTIFGFSDAIVISGSMHDTIEVNDMIITHAQEEYHMNEIILFVKNDYLVTHRIVDVRGDYFVTQGDANNTVDEGFVYKEDIVGKVIIIIPYIGYVIGFLQTPLGMLCCLVLFVLFLSLPHALKKD